MKVVVLRIKMQKCDNQWLQDGGLNGITQEELHGHHKVSISYHLIPHQYFLIINFHWPHFLVLKTV